MESRTERLNRALEDFEKAASLYTDSEQSLRHMYFLMAAKAFEVLVDYAWKHLLFEVNDQGVEALSPKQAIREGARLGIIDCPEDWISAINARNRSVHDYYNLPEADFLKQSKSFLPRVRELLSLS